MQVNGPVQTLQPAPLRVRDVESAMRAEASRPLSYAEEFQSGATVAALDVFAPTSQEKPWHGDFVNAILTSKGLQDGDVQKIQHGMSDDTCHALKGLLDNDGPEETPGQRLDGYIELSGSQKLIQTNGTLAQILADPDSSLKVLNQSQGNSRVDIYELLESAAKPKAGDEGALSQTGKRLAEVVGLDPAAENFEGLVLNQRLADRVASVIDNSPLIAAEQKRHGELLQALRDKGVLMVTSAGNNADELGRVRSDGIRVSDNFDDDLTSVGPKLVVGALDAATLPTDGNSSIAYFSSLYAGVNLLAPGVGVQTPLGAKTGTSFAAPQVALQAELIRRENPTWSVDQVEAQTRKQFLATDGFNILT